jgi:hypothetical protein
VLLHIRDNGAQLELWRDDSLVGVIDKTELDVPEALLIQLSEQERPMVCQYVAALREATDPEGSELARLRLAGELLHAAKWFDTVMRQPDDVQQELARTWAREVLKSVREFERSLDARYVPEEAQMH